MIVLLLLFFTGLALGQERLTETKVLRDLRIEMRDGVKLAADVYLPGGGAERRPTLVARTPYNRAGLRRDAEWFAQQGYAFVAVDVRGRFASEGPFYPFVNEGPDGYDMIEWAARQEWSNGKVGTYGASYLAWDQYRAALENPPHLVAMFANVGGADFYQEFGYPGGTLNLGWGIWIARSAETSPPAQSLPEQKAVLSRILESPGEWLRQHPRDRAKVFDPFPTHRRIYDDFLAHPTFDAYWHDPAFHVPATWGRMKDVPTLFVSGWYDYFSAGVLRNFENLSAKQQSPHRLVMGPWWHAVGPRECGDGDFGTGAQVDMRALSLEWFNHWLKGEPLTTLAKDRVRYFRMGGGSEGRTEKGRREHGGSWETASTWPPPAIGRSLYLEDGGHLSGAPTKTGSRTYVFDPERPVPTIGGRFGIGAWTPNCFQNQVCRAGVLGCENEDPLANRPDVLSFSSEPLEEAVETTGAAKATLWVSSDSPDTDFTVKLIDVAPDGYAAIIADGQIRLRYRDGFARENLNTPGEIVRVEIPLYSSSNLFAKGHRIRVDISSSNWPQFESNSNTGEAVNDWTRRRKARNSVYLGPERPSKVQLPVVPVR